MSRADVVDTGADGAPEPKQNSLLRASALMASGTMVSRVLGLVRSMMLLAVIGSAGGGVAAAFQTANALPNTVFNILASGIFDAVLVPQIVGAMKRRHDGETYINRLLTLAGVFLFLITIVSMVAAPLLVIVTAAGYDAEIRSLAILFTLLCLPQLFFYGIYNLLGELLNARKVFGPYMWAPVVNNIIGIAGLIAFLLIWGSTPTRIEVADFTSSQFWLLGGSATLGVIGQALILIIPMKKAGIRFKPDFHFRQTSFGSVSKVAGWTFATLMVSQIGILSTNNIAAMADAYAKTNHVLDIAGINAYATAFMIFMVPQSLITVSLTTAIFTNLAEAVIERDDRTVADNYELGVRTITALTLLAAAIFMAGSVPMMQMVLPTQQNQDVVIAYAIILAALMPGVASTGMALMSQRVFFAYEDVKPVFLIGIPPMFVQVIVGWSLYAVTGAHWWVAGAALAETAARVTQGFIAVRAVGKRKPMVNRSMLLRAYLTFLGCAAVAGLTAFAALALVGITTTASSAVARLLIAAAKMVLVAAVATPVYMVALKFANPALSALTVMPILTKFGVPHRIRTLLAAPVGTKSQRPRIMKHKRHGEIEGAMKDEERTDEDLLGAAVLDNADDAGADAALDPAPAALSDADPLDETLEPEGDTEASDVESPDSLLENAEDSGDEDFVSEGLAPESEEKVPFNERVRQYAASASAAFVATTTRVKERFAEFKKVREESLEDEGVENSEDDELDVEAAQAPDVVTNAQDAEKTKAPEASQTAEGVEGTEDVEAGAAEAGVGQTKSLAALTSIPLIAAAKQKLTTHITLPRLRKAENSEDAEPSDAERPDGIDPTRPTLIVIAVLTLIATIWAFTTAFSPVEHESFFDDEPSTRGARSAQSGDEVAAPPVVSAVSVLSWNNDDGDHPDEAPNMIDGNPQTSWNSRYYEINQFYDDNNVTIVLTLEQTAAVSTVTLQMDPSTQGGQVIVRKVEDPANPRGGTQIASSSLSASTVISLEEPVEASAIALSFKTMPTSVDSLPWAWINEITIE